MTGLALLFLCTVNNIMNACLKAILLQDEATLIT